MLRKISEFLGRSAFSKPVWNHRDHQWAGSYRFPLFTAVMRTGGVREVKYFGSSRSPVRTVGPLASEDKKKKMFRDKVRENRFRQDNLTLRSPLRDSIVLFHINAIPGSRVRFFGWSYLKKFLELATGNANLSGNFRWSAAC
jgi:hypothetical protein